MQCQRKFEHVKTSTKPYRAQRKFRAIQLESVLWAETLDHVEKSLLRLSKAGHDLIRSRAFRNPVDGKQLNITACMKPEARLNNIYHFPPSSVKSQRHSCGPMTSQTQYLSLHTALSFPKMYVLGSVPPPIIRNNMEILSQFSQLRKN